MSDQAGREATKRTGGPASKNPRKDGWSKDVVLHELQDDPKITLWQIFTRWAGQATPFSCRDDFRRWLKSDEEFAARVKPLLADRGQYKSGKPPSRTRREHRPQFADWKKKFGADLFESGSRLIAAEKSPYKWEMIVKKLDPNDHEFDAELFDIVKVAELRICSEMESGFLESYRAVAPGKDKAWISRQWLERRDPKRWGRQVEMIVSGNVKHEHTHILEKPREVRLLELAQDQAKFFGKDSPQKALESGRSDDRVIDAEVIEDRVRA